MNTDNTHKQNDLFSSTGLVIGIAIITMAVISTISSVLISVSPLVSIAWLLLNTWLFTGLFITAHDAMHLSLAPHHKKTNHLIGKLSLGIYAGLSYTQLLKGHIAHHRYPAQSQDPDYDETHTDRNVITGFFLWYWSFMRSYLSWHPFLYMSVSFTFFAHVLGISQIRMLLFWILPQVLSTFQLFFFGTYLPHKGHFVNEERFRSNQYPTWLSLLSCYHFGYHKEHHLYPNTPWWQLPKRRADHSRAKTLSECRHG